MVIVFKDFFGLILGVIVEVFIFYLGGVLGLGTSGVVLVFLF